METNEEDYFLDLKNTFNKYSVISEESWLIIEPFLQFQYIKKGEILLRSGQTAKNIHFICKGILSAYFTDDDANIYTKNIFMEKSLAASTVSLLHNAPSNFSIEALEDTILINLNFKTYKSLIYQHEDIKNFYISYLEQNWIVVKEQKEISLVMENATERYLKLLEQHPDLETRISQYHIASHLGITPTQLSRIRKTLKK